ncbi:MAG: hypothetical protein IKU19_01705, partial [Clostridia bacterium]|nr:hypothetical protein [Clostridia bacterium]
YTLTAANSDGGTILSYYTDNGMFAINNVYVYKNGAMDMTQIQVKRGYTVYDYYYFIGDEVDTFFAGQGKLDASTFTKSTVEGFSDYEGVYKTVYTENLNIALKDMLKDTNDLLVKFCGMTLKDFGFKVF